jgi:hypothetical protein
LTDGPHILCIEKVKLKTLFTHNLSQKELRKDNTLKQETAAMKRRHVGMAGESVKECNYKLK